MVCVCVSVPDDELTESGRLRGQEHARNAREGGEAGPWHAASQHPLACLDPLSLASVFVFIYFFKHPQFTHVAGLGLLISASACHLLEARGEQTCCSEGPHATMRLVESIDVWMQWG